MPNGQSDSSSCIFQSNNKCLVQSLNKMYMKYHLHNKFRMIIFHDQKALSLNFKGIRSQMFFKKDFVKNLHVHRKTPGLDWLFIIVTGDLTQELSCEYSEIFKNAYFEEYLRTAASILLIIKLLIKFGHLPSSS